MSKSVCFSSVSISKTITRTGCCQTVQLADALADRCLHTRHILGSQHNLQMTKLCRGVWMRALGCLEEAECCVSEYCRVAPGISMLSLLTTTDQSAAPSVVAAKIVRELIAKIFSELCVMCLVCMLCIMHYV